VKVIIGWTYRFILGRRLNPVPLPYFNPQGFDFCFPSLFLFRKLSGKYDFGPPRFNLFERFLSQPCSLNMLWEQTRVMEIYARASSSPREKQMKISCSELFKSAHGGPSEPPWTPELSFNFLDMVYVHCACWKLESERSNCPGDFMLLKCNCSSSFTAVLF
jgi:hypothetical protein